MEHFSFSGACLLSLTGAAALTDARRGLIPNWLTLPPLCLAPLAHGLLSGPGALAWSVVGALSCAAVPLALFARGAMGGGDVKLFAAAGALMGAQLGLEVQMLTYVLAAIGAGVGLARRGQLGTALRRAFALLARSVWPRKVSARPALEAALTVRLGVAAFAACLVLESLTWELRP